MSDASDFAKDAKDTKSAKYAKLESHELTDWEKRLRARLIELRGRL